MNDVIRTSNELDEIVSHADLLLKSGDEVLSLTPDEWRKIRKATGVDTDLLKSALAEAFDWLCPPNGVGAAGDALREYLLRILPLIDMSTNTVLGKSVHAHETSDRPAPGLTCGCIEHTNGLGGVTRVWCGKHWSERHAQKANDGLQLSPPECDMKGCDRPAAHGSGSLCVDHQALHDVLTSQSK